MLLLNKRSITIKDIVNIAVTNAKVIYAFVSVALIIACISVKMRQVKVRTSFVISFSCSSSEEICLTS